MLLRLLYIPLGCAVSFLFMWPMIGSLKETIMLLIMSIVCTAGIGLVVWIPVWFLVGWATFSVINLVFGKSKKSATPPPLPDYSREQRAIINFLEDARRSGLSDEDACARLRAIGWPDNSIEEARRKLPPSGQ